MAKLEIGKGIDEYIAKLEKLDRLTKGMIKQGIYDGADIVADEMRKQIEALPVQQGKAKGKRRDPTEVEKQGLLDGFGISKMREDDGVINAKLGFHGYNAHKTKKWPNGQPNAMIAGSIERGTTFMNRHAFVSKAVRNSQARCEQAIAAKIDEIINKEME